MANLVRNWRVTPQFSSHHLLARTPAPIKADDDPPSGVICVMEVLWMEFFYPQGQGLQALADIRFRLLVREDDG